jgi:hypothetical protein
MAHGVARERERVPGPCGVELEGDDRGTDETIRLPCTAPVAAREDPEAPETVARSCKKHFAGPGVDVDGVHRNAGGQLEEVL